MSIKRIFSAGGIILRPAQQDQGKRQVLITQHSGHKGWDFPKGHIEGGESQESAALREAEEETGVKAEIIERVGQTQYFYWENGEKILKTVTFFLMKFIEQGKATTAFEVSDKIWLPVDLVEKQLTFKDTKEMWGKVKDRIKKQEL